MKSNLLVLLSEYPINHVVYKDFDILNIDKQTFRNDISDDNLWFIEALNYSNFLKNELEFERPIGYTKVLFQKIDTISLKNVKFMSTIIQKKIPDMDGDVGESGI